MNKHDLRVVKTKSSIHQALLELLKNKPLAQIRVTELCKEANINRGTFYFHYNEVGDAFTEFFKEIVRDFQDSYNEPYKYMSTLEIEKLDPANVRIFHHIKKYENFYRIVLSPSVPATYYFMLFDAIRMNLIKDKNTSEHEAVNEFFYSYQANAIIGLIIEWFRHDFKESIEEMNEQLLRIINFKLQNGLNKVEGD